MEAVSTSETSVSFCQTTRCNIPWDSHLHNRRCDYLISHQNNLFIIQIFSIRTRSDQESNNIFMEKLLMVSKWQPCRILGNISWRHIPEERMAARGWSWVSWHTVQSCLSLRRIVKWMCWRSNVFASSSARNSVRRPQKRTKCYNKHSEKQLWVTVEDAVVTSAEESEASPAKCQDIADRFLWRRGSGALRVSSPTPDHESACPHNRSATPSRCSSS
jgi:hypothetical protein